MDSQRDLSLVTQTAVDPSRISFALESPEQPLAPPRIPDYRLIKHIGSGAFGDVWLAEEKHVAGVFRAVKVLRSALGERLTTGSAATVRELRGLQLYETRARGHAHLVQLLHVGCVEHSGESGRDGIYYAMEIADHAGGAQPFTPDDYRPLTLRSLLRYGGRLPAERAIEYQIQLLDGLDHLHRNGLQHRDVKPGNLLFVRGKLKLADLGLTSSDETHQTCGTVGYLPPDSNQPNDLYAAGIVLYEMLTGLPASQFPDWPEDLDPSQDARLAGLRAIFSRACDRDPQRRFADAPSFRTALEKANTASASINQVRAGDRRARRLAFLACGMCVAIAIAAAWFGYELYGAKYGFSYGKPPFNGSVAKLYSVDRKYLFEWSTSEKRLAVPTNSDERRVELFDLEARLDGSQLLIRGQTRCWSLGNPLPRRIEEANPGKHGEFVQVFLVLKTDNVEQLAKEVEELASKPERQRGRAAREKQFDTQFPKEIQLLLSAQLASSPGNINGFMPGIDLAELGLTPNKSYPILAFVTAAESDEMYQALAICIAADAGLRLGSVQYTPNPD